MSLISRKLLTPDEVLKIENPFAIVMMAGKPPALTNIPDISKMHFNKLNGMGTRKENQELRIKREEAREERPIKPIKVWNIWNQDYTKEEEDLLDELQMSKIKLADAIFVVNVNQYIGFSTNREIEFAKSLNKEVMYLEDKK